MTMMIDGRPIARAPLGRSRFLAGVGAALVAVATRRWFPDEALASHDFWGNPCYGYHKRYACSGCTCTSSGCNPKYSCNNGTTQCWQGCKGCVLYRCCDWKGSSAGNCICRCAVYNCC